MAIENRRANEVGFTLLELTLAVAIFAIAMGVTAKSLISAYSSIDMQNQRVVAFNQCRAVLSQMRDWRDTHPNTAADQTGCVKSILAQFPQSQNSAGPAQLRNSKINITYENTTPATANPLVATVTITWNDLRNRAMTARLTSGITDQ